MNSNFKAKTNLQINGISENLTSQNASTSITVSGRIADSKTLLIQGTEAIVLNIGTRNARIHGREVDRCRAGRIIHPLHEEFIPANMVYALVPYQDSMGSVDVHFTLKAHPLK